MQKFSRIFAFANFLGDTFLGGQKKFVAQNSAATFSQKFAAHGGSFDPPCAANFWENVAAEFWARNFFCPPKKVPSGAGAAPYHDKRAAPYHNRWPKKNELLTPKVQKCNNSIESLHFSTFWGSTSWFPKTLRHNSRRSSPHTGEQMTPRVR